MERRRLIVGIDAGKTAAVACLSFDGELLYASHKTFGGYDWMVAELSAVGIYRV